MKDSKFRRWVTNLYYEAMRERYEFGEGEEDIRIFFNRYKYWLKRRYTKEVKTNEPD